MKIAGLDVPPLLQDLYDKHVTIAVAADPTPTIARTATATGKPATRRKNRGAATDADRVVAMLADAYRYNLDTPPHAAWRAARKAELRAGVFNPLWWQPAPLLSEQRLTVQATSQEQLPRPAYDYQLPDNRPTVTTWQPPSPSTNPIGYHGTVTAGLYTDEEWTYHVAEYRLPPKPAAAGETHAVAIISGTIEATADKRASKAMFSLMARFEQLNDATQDLTAAPPPIAPATSHYWPFAPPLGIAPYYHATLDRLVFQLPIRTDANAHGQIARLTYSVRPMLGRSNNNNANVQTQFIGTASVFMIPAPPLSDDTLVAATAEQTHPQLYTFTPTSTALTQWRRDFDFVAIPALCQDGYVARLTDGNYTMLARTFHRLFDFEPVTDYQGAPVQPFPTADGYVAYYATTTPPPTQWHRVRWNTLGEIVSTEDVPATPANTQYAYRHLNHSPNASIINYDGASWSILNSDDQPIATITNIDPDIYQLDFAAFGREHWWIVGPDSTDTHHVYVIPAPTDEHLLPPQPPNIPATEIAVAEIWNPNASTLGDDLYLIDEAGTPYAWSPSGDALPFEGLPTGYYLTPFHPVTS